MELEEKEGERLVERRTDGKEKGWKIDETSDGKKCWFTYKLVKTFEIWC